MNSLSCISDAKINCCKDGKCSDSMCPDTHHCCAQKADKPILGLCVRRDKDGGTNNCDRSRGLPIESCRDSRNRDSRNKNSRTKNNIENYERVLVSSKEGYEGYNNNSDYTTIAIKLLLIILAFLGFYVYFSRK
jgi:hypothetical protein